MGPLAALTKLTDLHIRIQSADNATSSYAVTAELEDGAVFRDTMQFDPTAWIATEAESLGARSLEEVGLSLFDMLFAGTIRQAYDRAFGASGGRVRFRLSIDDDSAQLRSIPWERLYHMREGRAVPLLTSTYTPFSRFVAVARQTPEPLVQRPIRMLFAIASPSDLDRRGGAPLDPAGETTNLRQALGAIQDLQQRSLIHIRLLASQAGLPEHTRQQLTAEGYEIVDGPVSLTNLLRHMRDSHVVHLMCHGSTSQDGKNAYLILEETDGTTDFVSGQELVNRLASADTLPHLMFLASGDRPRQGRTPHAQLGQELVRIGIPAVIAMQDVITVRSAIQLTGDFYRSLLQSGLVDRALSEARFLLFDQNNIDWTVPVLHSSLRDGRLFAQDAGPTSEPELSAELELLPKSPLPSPAQPPSLVQYVAGINQGLNRLRAVADLSEQLRDLRNQFALCSRVVERAESDPLKIQVDQLRWSWDVIRQNQLVQLELLAQSSAEPDSSTWLSPIMQQAEAIDNALAELTLVSLAKDVKTFETQLARLEPQVWIRLNQTIGELASQANRTLGLLATD